MNCRDFQNEFEERAELSNAATLHFKDCADCEKLHREQSHIWQMIESLPEVAAPADFNAQFRSRIARSKAGDFRPAWWKSLRYVVPVFAAVLVLTMIFASQNFFVSTPQTDLAVVQKDDTPTELINNEVEAKSPNTAVSTTNSDYQNANYETTSGAVNSVNPQIPIQKTPLPEIAEIPKSGKREMSENSEDNSGGGVKDFGVNTAAPPILPNGFPQMENKTAPNPGDMINSNGQNIESLLSFIGIETTSENGKLRVNAVKSGSIPARSGLKSGDLIETIDGKPVFRFRQTYRC